MTSPSSTFSPKNALSVIALFVGVVELAFAYPVTTLSGGAQLSIIAFMILFPVLVLSGFFFVLIRYPENFYSPSDFQDPQAFAQIVARRDKKLNEHLEHRTSDLNSITTDLQQALKDNAREMAAIQSKLDGLPELDKDALEIEFTRVNELLKNITLNIDRHTELTVEYKSLKVFVGIHRILLDADTFQNRWSIDFIMIIAIAVLKDISKRKLLDIGGNGSVKVDDGDFVLVFAYDLNVPLPRYGGTVTIKYTQSYCTVS